MMLNVDIIFSFFLIIIVVVVIHDLY